MSIKMKKRIVHWTDPDYLEQFYEGWGSGQSITYTQSKRSDSEKHQEPQQEPDPSQPFHEGRDSATSDSRED